MTGRPTVFTSGKWLQNPNYYGDVEISFLEAYNKNKDKRNSIQRTTMDFNRRHKSWNEKISSAEQVPEKPLLKLPIAKSTLTMLQPVAKPSDQTSKVQLKTIGNLENMMKANRDASISRQASLQSRRNSVRNETQHYLVRRGQQSFYHEPPASLQQSATMVSDESKTARPQQSMISERLAVMREASMIARTTKDVFEAFSLREERLKAAGVMEMTHRKTDAQLWLGGLSSSKKRRLQNTNVTKVADSSPSLTDRIMRANYAKQKQFIQKHMKLVFGSKVWEIGAKVTHELNADLEEKKRIMEFKILWTTILFLVKVMGKFREKIILFKVVDTFKKAKLARFERVISFAKRLMPSQMANRDVRNGKIIRSSLMFAAGIISITDPRQQARDILGGYFKSTHKIMQLLHAAKTTMQHLTKIVNQSFLFLRQIRSLKSYVRKQWRASYIDLFGEGKVSSSTKLVTNLETIIIKFISDYVDSKRVTELILASKKAKFAKKKDKEFDPQKLYDCPFRRVNKAVLDILLECMAKRVGVRLEDDAKKNLKVSGMDGSGHGKSTNITNSKKSQHPEPGTLLDTLAELKGAKVSPFLKFDLLTHCDKNLMSMIQREIVTKAAAIRASYAMENSKRMNR
jgi:hypothetical protein